MSSADAPPPSASDRVGRFRRDLTAALGRAVAPGDRFALAVSGGPDSMAMLWLAAQAFPGQVIAATVDHRLRSESADEAAVVARWCAGAGVPHAALAIADPREEAANLQGWARQERYKLLRRWAVAAGAVALATAHHADDQAETFLMRAARGSGLSGLAGVRPRVEEKPSLGPARSEEVNGRPVFVVEHARLLVLRPLLGWTRAMLRDVVGRAGLPVVDDPSNADPRFDRTRFRAWLAAAPWLDTVQVARSAVHLAGVDADLRALSRWFWIERGLPGDPLEARVDVAGLPRGVARYLVRLAIDHVHAVNGMPGDPWRGSESVEGVLDALEAGRRVTRAGVMASAAGSVWRFREAPPRRS